MEGCGSRQTWLPASFRGVPRRSRLEGTRDDELFKKRRVAFVAAVNSALINIGPMLLALLTFLVYGLVGPAPLSAGEAFAALSLFSILRVPLAVLPTLATTVAAGARRRSWASGDGNSWRHLFLPCPCCV